MFFFKVLSLVVLLMIFVQDIRSRAVYWLLFPILASLLFFLHVQKEPFSEIWQPFFINIAFLVFQFFLVSVYFSLKSKVLVNITVGLLGWGDILFIVCAAFYLSVLNFLFFYIVSLMLVLMLWLVWQAFSKEKNQQIPLAGYQAFIFTVFLTGDWFFKLFDLTNDSRLLDLIFK